MAVEDYRLLFGDDFDDILEALVSGGLTPGVEKMILGTVDRMVFNTNIFAESIKGTVANMKARGISAEVIERTLQNDMVTGGRIFGQLKNGTKEGIAQGINQSAAMGQYDTYADNGFNDNSDFEWITVSGHKICIDCTGREGMVLPFKEWESLGFPGSGWSVCGGYCYCVIDPVGKMDKNINVDVREKGAGRRPPPGYRAVSRKDATPHVDKALAKAKIAEIGITKLLKSLAKELGMPLHDLRFRLKARGKAITKFQKESLENFWGVRTTLVEDLVDLVRYTTIVKEGNYIEDVLNYFNRLEAAGYRKITVKNYWSGNTGYKGMNTKWMDPDGQIFEMQFNTPRSQFIKDKYSHILYEQIRKVGISPAEKARLKQELIDWWSTVDAPQGWESILDFQAQTSYPPGWSPFN